MASSKTVLPRTHHVSRHDLSEENLTRTRRALLSWFSENARVLPWRVPSISFESATYKDYVHRLYRCLISETMLQQTQVKTVISYYTKWLEKFPTIEELANAQEEDVMACWAGLGYYSRAKRLQQAAQYLVTNYVSKELEFSRHPAQWIKHVPGVGPYTAGAILSISFGVPSAIVDGNVQRVLSRFLAVHGNTSTPKAPGTKLMWERAAQLVEGRDPGLLNQSLMELGATICTPTLPSCSQCPIKSDCLAYSQSISLTRPRTDFFTLTKPKSKSISKSNDVPTEDIEDLCHICPESIDPTLSPSNPKTYIQSLYPYKPPKKAHRLESSIVTVLSRGSQVYLERKERGLLAGLYDFPTLLKTSSEEKEEEEEDGEEIIDRLVIDQCRKTGGSAVGTTVHLFTHIKRTSHVILATQVGEAYLQELKLGNESGKWVECDKIGEIGVSELCLKNLRVATSAAAAVAVAVAGNSSSSSSATKKRPSSSSQTVMPQKMKKKTTTTKRSDREKVMNHENVAKQCESESQGDAAVTIQTTRKVTTETTLQENKKIVTKSKIFDMFGRRSSVRK